MGWIRRLRSTLGGSTATDAFDEEAQYHIEARIEEYIRKGMTPEAARREAYRRFGSVTRARERTRDADTLAWLTDARQDLRYAARQLVGHPGFALTAILTLAIGIAANTAIFSVVDALLLRLLPVEKPQDLVLFNWLEGRQRMRMGMDGVRTTDEATRRGTSTSFSYPTFQRLQQTSQSPVQLFAFAPVGQLNVIVDGQAEVASGQYVSGDYFTGLGVTAAIGRTLSSADDRPGTALAATITHRYWTRRFDRDPRIVGRDVVINKMPATIVGVTPEGFAGALDVAQSPDFTVPFAAEPLLQGGQSDLARPAFLWVRMMGRLQAGVSPDRAAASLTPVMQQAMLDEWNQAIATATERPPSASRTLDDASTLRAEPGGQGLMFSRRSYAQPLMVLMGSAALVLLVACLNIANLLLARGTSRRKEIATRLALGATRARVVRQLVTESLMVAAIGGAVGAVLARWATALLIAWRPWGDAAVVEASLDWRVFGFCGAVAAGTGLLFGLVPAMRATRVPLAQATKRTTGPTSTPLMRLLVAGQVALSLVLLVAAGLFVGTLRNLHGVDKGFDTGNLLLFRIQPQSNGYESSEISSLYTRLLERVGAIPGVRSATLSRHPLLARSRRSESVSIEGASAQSGAGALVNTVAPSFFSTMDIPLLLGRAFDDRDQASAPKVAIVNERFVATLLDGDNPIGRRLRMGDGEREPLEIVGMTRDATYADLRTPIAPTVYVPFMQDVPGQANFAVRTTGDALALAPAIRSAARDVDAALPLFDIRSQTDQLEESLARETMFARLSTVFGLIVVALAAIGLYGTMAYAVAQRTSEIGLRMALGAGRTDVVRMVVRQALVTAVIGVVVGIPLAVAATRAAGTVLADVLFGLSPYDPVVTGGAAALLLAVAMLAAFLPSRTAAHVDPVRALQQE